MGLTCRAYQDHPPLAVLVTGTALAYLVEMVQRAQRRLQEQAIQRLSVSAYLAMVEMELQEQHRPMKSAQARYPPSVQNEVSPHDSDLAVPVLAQISVAEQVES